MLLTAFGSSCSLVSTSPNLRKQDLSQTAVEYSQKGIKGGKHLLSKTVCEMLTITEDLLKDENTQHLREMMLTMSNKTGKSEHEDGQRLAVALELVVCV